MLNKTATIKGILILLLAIFITVSVVFLALGLLDKTTPTSRSGQELINKTAPGFNSVDIFSNQVALSDYIGNRVVVLNFWASWCPPCREETPGMERIWTKYRDNGLLLVGINVQDSVEDAEAYVDEFQITFPIILDRDGSTSINYGVTGLPVSFLLNSEGIIVDRWVGAIGEAQLEKWISSQ